jgi:hypothetical protein
MYFNYFYFSFTFFCAGIVYKGDGSWLLAGANSAPDAPAAPSVRLGTGAQRDFACQQPDCAGVGASLLSIVSMAAGPDGSLYIGDYNLIRRVWPTGGSSGGGSRVETIFEFGPRQQSFLYTLATSPGEEGVYLTNSERYQVWRLPLLTGVERPGENYEAVAGTGEHCVPVAADTSCGDGGPALQARLIFPKVRRLIFPKAR